MLSARAQPPTLGQLVAESRECDGESSSAAEKIVEEEEEEQQQEEEVSAAAAAAAEEKEEEEEDPKEGSESESSEQEQVYPGIKLRRARSITRSAREPLRLAQLQERELLGWENTGGPLSKTRF